MPELPEVETIVQDLVSHGIVNKTIKEAKIFWPRIVAPQIPEDWLKNVKNQTVESIARRGKYIVFTLSTDYLVVHLRMTGKFLYTTAPHEHLRLIFEDGTILSYNDTRKFGRLHLLPKNSPLLPALGREPLDDTFTVRDFCQLFSKKKGKIKPLLLNQAFLSGLGNIYVDEALWEAKIHPEQLCQYVQASTQETLFNAIRKVLKKGIASNGTSLGTGKSNYFRPSGKHGTHQNVMNVFRQTGLPCPRCQTPIERIIVAQRSTHFCPHCQKIHNE